MVEETVSFAALLRRYRGAAGLTQEALAEQARISARAVSDLERGQDRVPRATTLQLLATALGLTPEQRRDFVAAAQRAGRQAENIPSTHQAPAAPVPAALPAPPIWLTPLIGREREEEAIAALLREGVRLVTLTGPGGVGKTRLAAHIATVLAGSFPGGVAFVDLTAVREPEQVLPTVARALAIREEAGRALAQTMAATLRDRALLLVLDNMEQVAGAGPDVVALLTSCPRVQALVTSRAALRVQGEQEYPVPPLALPERGGELVEATAAAPAVRLFAARARAARSDFALTAANAATVVEVCRRLDGLPLALELAAARIKLLPPAALLRHLERDLAVLTGHGADRPERHRTLTETIAWSYALLTLEERTLFARLGAFEVGGATLEAVEAICASPGQAQMDVLAVLETLVDQSLVLVDGADEPRVRLLETIRVYALERLAAGGDEATLRERHLACYLALAEHADSRLHGPDQALWLARLEAEHDNLRAALRWALGRKDGELGLWLAGALCTFWAKRGYLAEGRRWLGEALTRGATAPRAPRARALRGAGVLADLQGDFAHAVSLHEESLALYRDLGERQGIAAALKSLGYVATEQGEYGRATALLDEALALQRELGDTEGAASSLMNLGVVASRQGEHGRAASLYEQSLALKRTLGDKLGIAALLNNLGVAVTYQGQYGRAVRVLEEGLALQRELGDRQGIANSLMNLGLVAYQQGDYGRTAALYEESLALFRELGARQGIAFLLNNLGDVAYLQGQYGRATALHEESLALKRELGDSWGIAASLVSLGGVAHAQGDYQQAMALLDEALRRSRDIGARDLLGACLECLAWAAMTDGQAPRAARLAGAAEAMREALHLSLYPEQRGGHERMIQAARAALGEEAVAAAWAEGRALPLEEAIALAPAGAGTTA